MCFRVKPCVYRGRCMQERGVSTVLYWCLRPHGPPPPDPWVQASSPSFLFPPFLDHTTGCLHPRLTTWPRMTKFLPSGHNLYTYVNRILFSGELAHVCTPLVTDTSILVFFFKKISSLATKRTKYKTRGQQHMFSNTCLDLRRNFNRFETLGPFHVYSIEVT